MLQKKAIDCANPIVGIQQVKEIVIKCLGSGVSVSGLKTQLRFLISDRNIHLFSLAHQYPHT